MAATQLGLYNEALRLIGERPLALITEDRHPRRVLDAIWDDGIVDACLEQGLWNFAMRAVEIAASTTVTPAFGYTYAFDKPSDWIRTAGVASDEFFNTPLTRYMEEVGFWFADVDPLYVRYVSNDSNYGTNLDRWPQSFTKYVAAAIAADAAPTITQDEKKIDRIIKIMLMRRVEARSKDAMNDASAFLPQGSWSSARLSGTRRDRGNRGNLIG